MPRINVNILPQSHELIGDDGIVFGCYGVWAPKNGLGEVSGSFCTPCGRHVIRAKIGAGVAPNTVFVERRPTGGVYVPELAVQSPPRDLILTRNLWLSGCEVGSNCLGRVDGRHHAPLHLLNPR